MNGSPAARDVTSQFQLFHFRSPVLRSVRRSYVSYHDGSVMIALVVLRKSLYAVLIFCHKEESVASIFTPALTQMPAVFLSLCDLNSVRSSLRLKRQEWAAGISSALRRDKTAH